MSEPKFTKEQRAALDQVVWSGGDPRMVYPNAFLASLDRLDWLELRVVELQHLLPDVILDKPALATAFAEGVAQERAATAASLEKAGYFIAIDENGERELCVRPYTVRREIAPEPMPSRAIIEPQALTVQAGNLTISGTAPPGGVLIGSDMLVTLDGKMLECQSLTFTLVPNDAIRVQVNMMPHQPDATPTP